ncbi:MAG: hypothetical protein GY950_02695 [bacterium]|nr:hypothetical protein [bacterium]
MNEKKFAGQWEPESRDQLAEFVTSTGALLHFYDVHGFSLPDTIHNRIIPFSDTAALPRTLQPHEYVAFIRYKKSGKGQVDHQGKYNRDRRFLLENYKPVNVFGKPGGNNDINVQAPQSNPTIVLMKPKEEQ